MPFLTIEIFDVEECHDIVKSIFRYQNKFNKFPSVKELKLLVSKTVQKMLQEIIEIDISDYEDKFLLDQIEDFFKQKLAYNQLVNGVEQINKGETENLGKVVDKLKESISFSFNTDIGLKLFSKKGADKMYEFLHSTAEVIPTGVKEFDRFLKGGLHKKSLTVFLAESGKGKTLIKAAIAANQILRNYKVLYVTLELNEQYIGERILQNVFDLEQDNLRELSKESFYKRYKKASEKLKEYLIIKKYPARSLNANGLKYLLKELESKEKFKPDVVMVDYLGLFAPFAATKDAGTNEQGIVKCQELQAFTDDYDVPVLTSAQSNRSGYGSSHLNPTNIADSIGIMAEADVVVGATQTEEQRELNPSVYNWQIMKNRFGLDHGSCTVGVIYDMMKLVNLDSQEEQQVKDRELDEQTNDAVKEVGGFLKKEKEKKNKGLIIFDD